ncbi:YbaB/EbfC family nucleoid-associated protein [Micromonospora sp. CPCC 205539]|uniref:YbaB/EbfC family nucleoid-associated protein n=1 Tax=Micromonospora sp. CPCC 205539 TaxID=3122408 RepID=UPI002FF2432A
MWTDDDALDATRRRVDEWESTIAARSARTTALTRELAVLTGTARTADGTVEVTVDAHGRLVGLRLDDRVRARSGARTAEAVLETVRAAYADLVERVRAAADATLGADDPTARALVESYASRLERPGAPGRGTAGHPSTTQ